MKRNILLLVFALVVSIVTYSKNIDKATTKKVAVNFFNNQKTTKKISQSDLVLVKELMVDKIAVYQIFNVGDNDGFVIVSGSDKAKPVLAYSPKGKITREDLVQNPGFSFMLNHYKNEIVYAETSEYSPDNRTLEAWEQALSGEFDNSNNAEVKLTLTTEWNQEGHYNDLCPPTGTNGHPCNGIFGFCQEVPTGCPATTIAQIFRYFIYPQQSISDNQGYQDPDNFNNSTVPPTLEDPSYGTFTPTVTNFNWNNMPPEVTSTNNDVALLMRECGYAVQTDYSYNASGTIPNNIRLGIIDHFNYSNDAEVTYRVNSQNQSTWENSLIAEIQSERPIAYFGYGIGGHIWICMGYKINNQGNEFWMNWGWGGSSDGWFLLSGTLQGYSSNQGAIIHIHPEHQPDLIVQNPAVSPSTVGLGEQCLVSYNLNNQGDYASIGSTLKFYLSTITTLSSEAVELDEQMVPGLTPGAVTANLSKTLTIPDNQEPGDYNILFVADDGHIVHEGNETNNVAFFPIEIPPPSVISDVEDNGLSLNQVGQVQVETTIGATGEYYVGIWNQSGLWSPPWDWQDDFTPLSVNVGSQVYYLTAGQSFTFTFNVIPTSVQETFQFWLYKKNNLGLFFRVHRVTVTLNASQSNVQVALVLDRSGSMGWYGYLDAAKTAAKSFVDLMNLNDWVAVTSFDHTPSINFPFTQLTTQQIKTNAKNAINSIALGGATSVGAGMQIAQNQLNNGNTGQTQGMILLSDGYENSAPWVSAVLPTIPANTDIYTIALGPDSDQGLLNNIASSTGGFYSFSPNTSRLSLIYNTINANVTGQQTLAWFNGLIAQGQNLFQQAIIDAGAVFTNFSLTWPGSDLDLVLTAPNGIIIDHNVTDPDISFTSGDTYETYTIQNPLPGQYTLTITGVSVSGQEDYNLTVGGESQLTMHVALNKNTYGINEPILVTAQLSDAGTPVTGATVSANVTNPTPTGYVPAAKLSITEPGAGKLLTYHRVDENHGQYLDPSKQMYYAYSTNLSSLPLFDDGAHGDGLANDGIYGNFYSNTGVAGSYLFDVTATGIAPVSGPFTRIDSKSTVVTTVQSILVTGPQTNVNWLAGSIHNVYWSSTNITGNVNIMLSTDGGVSYPYVLAADITDDGWESVTALAVQSATCRIRVQSVAFPGIFGINPGNFSILPCEAPVPVFTNSPGLVTCAGSEVFYVTQPGQSNYDWFVSGSINTDYTIVSGSVSTTSNMVRIKWLTTGVKTVTVNFTSSQGCQGIVPAVSSTTVSELLPLGVSITVPSNPVCQGTPVQVSATINNAGTMPNIQWFMNGGPAGSGEPSYTFTPMNQDGVFCIVTASDVCVTNNPAYSNEIIMTVIQAPSLSVTVTASANPVCAGASVTFTATVSANAESPAFQWYVNDIPSGTNTSTFTCTPVNGDAVRCVITASTICAQGVQALSNTLIMSVHPYLPAGVTVTPNTTQICGGTPVIYTAQPENGGNNPLYQWFVNGLPAGDNNPAFYHFPLQGDVVTCRLTSNLICITRNPVTSAPVIITVFPTVPVGIVINASATSVCPGTMVAFNAVATNAGAYPEYRWFVNGAQSGGNNSVFQYIPNNGDELFCMVYSTLTCITGNPATSNNIAMTVSAMCATLQVDGAINSTRCYNALQSITVAGNGNTFIVGESGVVTMVAGQNILYYPGARVDPGGYLRGYIAPTGPFCNAPALPSTIAGQDMPTLPDDEWFVKIYPNPTNGKLFVEFVAKAINDRVCLEILNMRGDRILKKELQASRILEVSLADQPVGLYFLRIISGNRIITEKIIRQ